MARPKGSLNKRTVEISAVLNRLEKTKQIDREAWLLRLHEIALDRTLSPYVNMAAIRLLSGYSWGLPRAALDLKTTHELGESFVDFLLRIGQSDQHRKNLEELDRRRQRMAAVTVHALPAEANSEAQPD